jgi:hypothetical protein
VSHVRFTDWTAACAERAATDQSQRLRGADNRNHEREQHDGRHQGDAFVHAFYSVCSQDVPR